jgi:hypothetical protein
MADQHNSIIAKAAKAALTPMGFRRKGQSRIWLADRGYWLAVVEFQPSSWSKGSYLNVAAPWLWSPPGPDESFVLSLDYGGRAASFIKFESEEQFAPLAVNLSESAAAESERLIANLRSIGTVAAALFAQEQELQKSGRGRHGGAYHAGVAAAITGNVDVARTMFSSILETRSPSGSIIHPAAQELSQALAAGSRTGHRIGAV